MLKSKALIGICSLLMLSGCGRDTAQQPAPAEGGPGDAGRSASAELRNANGDQVGTVLLREDARGGGGQDGRGVTVELRVQGLPPGERAFHIHQDGVCEPPGFQSAGPHWNPTGRQHGFDNPEGHHLGDMRNIEVGPDGSGFATRRLDGATIGGEHSVIGRAVVVHAGVDDYKSDPAGAAGDRIACGVIQEGDTATAHPIGGRETTR